MSWLIDAIRYVNLEDLTEILTKTNWDLTIRDAHDQTCVDYLIYLDDDDCCNVLEIMLTHNINPDLLKWNKFPVIYYFVIGGKERQVEILLKYNASPNLVTTGTMIGMATYKGYPTIVQMLLDHGGDPNLKDPEGETPLHDAINCNQYECARILLQKGADPDIPNSDGKTPKMIALYYNKQKMIDLLESYVVHIKEPGID